MPRAEKGRDEEINPLFCSKRRAGDPAFNVVLLDSEGRKRVGEWLCGGANQNHCLANLLALLDARMAFVDVPRV